MIKIRDLKRNFPAFGLNIECRILDVPSGSSAGIYGSSGSGKTLMSKIVSGIIKNYTGSVQTELSEAGDTYKKKIGYLPFTNTLYPVFKVREMMLFLISRYGIKEAEYDLKAEWFAQFREIRPFANRRICTLSAGELQSVKLFASVIHSPSVLVMDEPFNGLGTEDSEMIRMMVDDLKKRDVSILAFSSHKELLSVISDEMRTIGSGKVE